MQVDNLEILIQAEATKANSELDRLIGKLNSVSSALNGVNSNGLRNMASGITQLSKSMQSMSGVKTSDFTKLSSNIQKLGNINTTGLYQTSNALRNITNTMNGVGSLSSSAIQLGEFSKNISKLGGASVQKATTSLPMLSVALRDFMATLSTAPNVSENIIKMTNAMASLATQGSKYGSTMNGIAKASKTVASSTSTATNATKKYSNAQSTATRTASTLTAQLSKLAFAYFTVKRALNGVFGSVEKSMDFVETVNLFQTSFKKIGMETASDMGMEWGSETANQFAKGFINRAQNFNDTLTNALSLDPDVMMKYQALFAQMSNSMGLVSQSAMNISESFTMLGTDISSLWNIDIDKAMTKLQAGLAGQIRPLRELGVDISQTSLGMTALKYGIDDNVISMSQAAKVQLRWLSIMDQTEVAFGDMAKTIDSPANQLRILEQQWKNLSRSIGNVFLPIVTTVLPYINGLVIALRRMVDVFAKAVGFELPDYSDSNIYTDVTGDILDVEDATDGATKATEKLKKSMLGIDELNILNSNKSSNSGTTENSSGSGYDVLDGAISDKTASYMNKFNEELAKMNDKAKAIADVIQPKIENLIEWIGKLTPAIAGIAAAFVTYKTLTWFSNLAKKIGLLSLSPIGVIALAIGAFVEIGVALKDLRDDAAEADLDKRFGDIELSIKDVKDMAQKLTDGKYGVTINAYVTEKAKLDGLETNIQTAIDTLNKLNWKVSVGIKLTEGEKTEYQSAIDSFITNSNDYITQQQYVVSLAISATITDDSAFATEMQTMADAYYKGSKTELEGLGTKLRATMDNALADGVLDADESKLIVNLQKEMAEVLERTADAEFTAKMQMITVDGELTADSFKDVTAEVQKFAQERIDKATEAEFTTRAVIIANYNMNMKNATTQSEKNKLTKDYKADLTKLTDEFSKTKATITMDGLDFSTDLLKEKYGPELQQVAQALGTDFTGTVKDWIGRGDTTFATALELATHNAGIKFEVGLNEIDVSAKLGMEKLFKSLEPTKAQQLQLVADALKTGKAVPANVSQGLTDTALLGAVAKDIDSMNFLMGQKLSTDPTFLAALATSETAGKDLDDSLIAGLKSKIPDLELQGSRLVIKTDKAIKAEAKASGKDNMPEYAGLMIGGVNKAFNNDTTTTAATASWLKGIGTTVSNYTMPKVAIGLDLDLSPLEHLQKGLKENFHINIPTPGYSTPRKMATGGIPGFGEMFIAREAGPEMVGKIGRNNAVMNNNQIVDSVSAGVESAVMNVMMAFAGGQNNNNNTVVVESNLYVDSEKFYGIMEKGKQKYTRRNQTVTDN